MCKLRRLDFDRRAIRTCFLTAAIYGIIIRKLAGTRPGREFFNYISPLGTSDTFFLYDRATTFDIDRGRSATEAVSSARPDARRFSQKTVPPSRFLLPRTPPSRIHPRALFVQTTSIRIDVLRVSPVAYIQNMRGWEGSLSVFLALASSPFGIRRVCHFPPTWGDHVLWITPFRHSRALPSMSLRIISTCLSPRAELSDSF